MVNLFMDRLMLFGYLEELTSFNTDDVRAVIEEMANELNMGQGGDSPADTARAVEATLPPDNAQLLRLESLLLLSVNKLDKLEDKVEKLLSSISLTEL